MNSLPLHHTKTENDMERQCNVSKSKYVQALIKRKVDKGLHIYIISYNGYTVEIFDNEGTILSKKFDSPSKAVEYVSDYYKTVEKGKYTYSTLSNGATIPAQTEIYGNTPFLKDFFN